MSKITELTGLTQLTADDLVAIINDPAGAHTPKSAVINRLAAVVDGLSATTATQLDDDDLAMLIDDPSGSPAAKKITLAELGLILRNESYQQWPTDRWLIDVFPRISSAVGSCCVMTGCNYQSAGGFAVITAPDTYGQYVRYTGPASLSYCRAGRNGGQSFQPFYCGTSKFYQSWRVRLLRNTNTWVWFTHLDHGAGAAWNPADGLIAADACGFTFAHNSGSITDTNWHAIFGTAAAQARFDLGVAPDLVQPQLLEVESNDDCTSIEWRIDGVSVLTRTTGFPDQGMGWIMLAQANGAGNGGWDFYGARSWRIPYHGAFPSL